MFVRKWETYVHRRRFSFVPRKIEKGQGNVEKNKTRSSTSVLSVFREIGEHLGNP